MGVIYVRPNLINGKKYVGQATDLKERQRKWKCLTQKYAGTAINNARKKYGIEAFGFEILKECEDDELDYWEKYYIKELNTKAPYGYNLTDGGEGMTGYTHSEETRKKISDAKKGKKQSEEAKKKRSEALKGKHLSEEAKKKLSEAQKGEKNNMYGKHHSEETKKKMSDARKGKKSNMYGKNHTDEAKKKISEAKKGVFNIKSSKPVLQIDKQTNEIIAEFPSTMEVKRQLGFSCANISACCLGKPKYKSAYGFKWKYKEESVA